MTQIASAPAKSPGEAADVRVAVGRFIDWLELFTASSQDPHDFWAWPPGGRAKALYYRHRVLGSAAVLPLVLADAVLPESRRLVRRSQRFPIADAHYAMGFFTLWQAEQDPRWLQRARSFLSALELSRSPGEHYAWGLPFDWESSMITYPAGTPLITMTPYAYEAFEAGFEATGEPDCLKVMESAANFALSLSETEVEPGISAASYSPLDHRQVVNANAYRAFMLTAAGHRFKRLEWLEAANRSIRFVLRSQQADGSWPYATDGRDSFVDNIHTCFVLKNLTKVWRLTGQTDLVEPIRTGYGFYKQRLIDSAGRPIPFARKARLALYRRELYDYAEGINLALLLRDVDPDAEAIRHRLIAELLNRWVLRDGHFITRQMLIGTNRVPYHRWGQAQTFRALVSSCANRN